MNEGGENRNRNVVFNLMDPRHAYTRGTHNTCLLYSAVGTYVYRTNINIYIYVYKDIIVDTAKKREDFWVKVYTHTNIYILSVERVLLTLAR